MAVQAIRSGFHFRKSGPITSESHILVSAKAADGSSQTTRVYDNTFVPPATGDFSTTVLFTDSSATAGGVGRFSDAPDESVVYCDGTNSAIWAGTEARCPSFIVSDSTAGVNPVINYDFTNAVNALDPGIVATMYRAADTKVYLYIGALRPVKGVKFYMGNPNGATSSVGVKYWNGTAWVAVSGLSDGTASGVITLAVDGTISFDDQLTTAKTYLYGNLMLYFYQFIFTGLTTDTVTVSRCTLSYTMQPVKDIWDGILRPLAKAWISNPGLTNYADITAQVATLNYVPGDVTTAYQARDIGGTFYLGFLEPMRGVSITLPLGSSNVTGVINIWWWSGSAWTSLAAIVDGTTSPTAQGFHGTGIITWEDRPAGTEQKLSINEGQPLYYYRISYPAILDEVHQIDAFLGIPSQKSIPAHAFGVTWQNRTILLGEIGAKRSSILISSYGTNCVFNGSDSLEITDLGDDSPITAAGSLFTRYTGGFYDTLIICKAKETWALDGTTVSNYHLYKMSDRYGCIAPETFKVLPIAYEISQGITRHVAIWLSATGVVLFDGNTISEIDNDIKNYFQPEKSECINPATAANSIAFVDEREREYHLIFQSGTSGTAFNTELVYSIKRKAWFKVDRIIVLQCGFSAYSAAGVPYTYGGTLTGYLERLEDPAATDFDGNAIVHTIQTRDIPLNGWTEQTEIRYIKLVTNTNTGATAILSHYGDCSNTANSDTHTVSIADSSRRIVQPKRGVNWGSNVFHSIKIVNTAATLFEPAAVTGFYRDIRLDE